MVFIQDDQILNSDDSQRRPPPFGNFLPGFPNILPGSPPSQTPGVPPQSPGVNMNLGSPPNYIPSKNSPEVKSFQSSGASTKAVSSNSIRFCLFKFTYIWETNGNDYWAYIFNVDRRTVTGMRWFRGRWNYFGVDLRRIDSFVCYREALPAINSLYEMDTFLDANDLPNVNPNFNKSLGNKLNNQKENCNCNNKKRDNFSLLSKTEYTLKGVNETFSRVLSSVNIPEIRDDFIVNYIGDNDDNKEDFKAAFPCKQVRIINHRIVLEITYPSKFNKELIEDLNRAAYDSSLGAESALNKRNTEDFLSTLDVFEEIFGNIPTCLNVFTSEFNNKIKYLKLPKDILRNIEYKITKETIEDDWHVI